ncbi:hypothetical protein MOP88_17365 [Sphingomonas sp. WKB10]|nr:hypothetical protein [Sphingomonas sp. WKB10]
MNPYVTLGAADTDVAHAFYDAVLATIGWSAHASFPIGAAIPRVAAATARRCGSASRSTERRQPRATAR